MRRSLTKSEKTLLVLCGVVLAATGGLFAVRDYRTRMAAAQAKIAELEPRLAADAVVAADAPFWEAREQWLDSVMPEAGDTGKAHSEFLEMLLRTAKERGLTTGAPVMLKPEGGKHARDLSVTVEVTGPDSAVFRWLAGLQSPEKLQVIKYLQLRSQSANPPRMTGTVTVARLFRP